MLGDEPWGRTGLIRFPWPFSPCGSVHVGGPVCKLVVLEYKLGGLMWAANLSWPWLPWPPTFFKISISLPRESTWKQLAFLGLARLWIFFLFILFFFAAASGHPVWCQPQHGGSLLTLGHFPFGGLCSRQLSHPFGSHTTSRSFRILAWFLIPHPSAVRSLLV